MARALLKKQALTTIPINRWGFMLAFMLCLSSFAHGQVLRHEYLKYDFDTTGFGYNDPVGLGNAFFTELQQGRNLVRFFSTIQVFNYMITLSDMRHEKTMMAATDFYWKEFEAQRDLYCQQLLDNLDSRNINMQEATLDDVKYDIQRVNDTGVLASDIELIISYKETRYSVLLDDCGQVKGKWFLMTPFVLWQGKVGEAGSEKTN